MVSNQHKLEIKGYSRHSMKYDHSKLTRASPCTSFTVIKLNSETISDRENPLEYYLAVVTILDF
jgi:hypothetical protein